MTVSVLRGDARHLPLPDACVDLVATSPPYFGLRSYTDTCRICLDIRQNGLDPAEAIVGYEEHVRTRHHYDGQIGSEATPAEWLAAMLDCTREWMRVLKPCGSIFVNLGDTYAAGHGGSTTEGNGAKVRVRRSWAPNPRERPDLPDPPTSWSTREARVRNIVPGIPVKSLSGMPWRYALACIDQLGLILRAEIIWAKPNGLPESVTDRVRRAHEQVFHFTRLPRYYSAVDEVREPHGERRASRDGANNVFGGKSADAGVRHGGPSVYTGPADGHPLGKLPGSVWDIPSQPLTVPPSLGIDHFAAFPMELPRRIILGWSPPGVCTGCGEGRRPVADVGEPVASGHNRDGYRMPRTSPDSRHGSGASSLGYQRAVSLTGYACACGATDLPGPVIHATRALRETRAGELPPVRPAVVLDPFGGTGTTALVAAAYGRHGISVDRSADYCRLAAWRTTDPAERAKALEVPKPPPVIDGQDALFGLSELAP